MSSNLSKFIDDICSLCLPLIIFQASYIFNIYTSQTLSTLSALCISQHNMKQKQCLHNLEKFLLFQEEAHEQQSSRILRHQHQVLVSAAFYSVQDNKRSWVAPRVHNIYSMGEYPTLYYPVKRHCVKSHAISSRRHPHYKGLLIGVEWC